MEHRCNTDTEREHCRLRLDRSGRGTRKQHVSDPVDPDRCQLDLFRRNIRCKYSGGQKRRGHPVADRDQHLYRWDKHQCRYPQSRLGRCTWHNWNHLVWWRYAAAFGGQYFGLHCAFQHRCRAEPADRHKRPDRHLCRCYGRYRLDTFQAGRGHADSDRGQHLFRHNHNQRRYLAGRQWRNCGNARVWQHHQQCQSGLQLQHRYSHDFANNHELQRFGQPDRDSGQYQFRWKPCARHRRLVADCHINALY